MQQIKLATKIWAKHAALGMVDLHAATKSKNKRHMELPKAP